MRHFSEISELNCSGNWKNSNRDGYSMNWLSAFFSYRIGNFPNNPVNIFENN